MRESVEGKVVHAALWVNKHDSGFRWRIRTCNRQDDVLHQNRLSAASRAGNQRVRGVVKWRDEKEPTIFLAHANQQLYVTVCAVRSPSAPYIQRVKHLAIRTGNGDRHDARFGPDGNDFNTMGGEEFQSFLQHLVDSQVRRTLKLEKCGIRR